MYLFLNYLKIHGIFWQFQQVVVNVELWCWNDVGMNGLGTVVGAGVVQIAELLAVFVQVEFGCKLFASNNTLNVELAIK